MYKSKNKSFWFFNKIKSLFKWLTKTLYLILIASMLGFSNAYYNETRTIYDIRFEFKQEQVLENEDEEE
jgi:hypothetical protein